jgi:hypothetical protein
MKNITKAKNIIGQSKTHLIIKFYSFMLYACLKVFYLFILNSVGLYSRVDKPAKGPIILIKHKYANKKFTIHENNLFTK